MTKREMILVLDDGREPSQLVTRAIRNFKVYSEVYRQTISLEKIKALQPKGIIILGKSENFDERFQEIFTLDIPILAFGKGLELLLASFGGRVTFTDVDTKNTTSLQNFPEAEPFFQNVQESMQVVQQAVMETTHLPRSFQVIATDERNQPIALRHESDPLYGLNIDPLAQGFEQTTLLQNFIFKVANCQPNWTVENFIEEEIENIRRKVGDRKVLCGLSGGVDSSVVAALIHRALGDQLTCIFVDHGLLRKNEGQDVVELFQQDFRMNLIKVDAKDRFLEKLKGVTDPEEKRKIIGNEFIYVFDNEARKLKDMDFLAQGTLYSDVIESGVDGQVVKSHHNVGGLPEDMEFELIEPLRKLFKDEVRELGKALGLPDSIVWRQPFPGPGLGIRIIGEVTEKRLEIVREADAILREEIAKAGLDRKIWQYFAVLTNILSVGVTDQKRTYDYTVGIRAVHSVDGMTSEFAHIPYDVLETISARIVQEVPHVNRVVYDVTNKPPATIEWE